MPGGEGGAGGLMSPRIGSQTPNRCLKEKPQFLLRRIYVALAILLASLGYFKYSDFVYQSLQTAFGGASWFYHPTFLATILPLGISFYTFQIVAYFIDLRKGRTEHAKSLLQYTVFVTFFAQRIAGPIMRGRDYLPQLSMLRGATGPEFRAGMLLVLTGLFKKVVLADFIAHRVDRLFSADSFTQPEAWIASALFAFQIYFDFSGYVDIALGVGKMLGIKLSQNFLTPYLSRSPREFWNRWNITLSSAGSRKAGFPLQVPYRPRGSVLFKHIMNPPPSSDNSKAQINLTRCRKKLRLGLGALG